METLLNDFSPGLFVVQTILFIALIALMVKFAWKPIMGSLEERETGIKDALEAAERAKTEMQNVTADSERLLQEARMEREAMMKEARELKEKIVSDAQELARTEGDKMIAQAQLAIEGEKKAAVAEIKDQVAILSLEIAEKIIKGEFSDKSKQLKLVEELVGDIKLN